ncbi:hypothetical protein WJX84_004232 [Apatococcus fuscideae]|uniref:Uncharacterized protein n=1 Tax=Apatococcus fuscideae TaxID=2026836 RepID=A0AAW1TEW3_9CHLO
MAAQTAAAAAKGSQLEAVRSSEAAAAAQQQAAAAQAAVLAAAKDLLVAKTAEVGAAALLEQGKDADPAAAALLKVQAADKCAQHLKAANKAAAEAEKAATEAASQAAAAKTAAASASDQADGCEASKSALKAGAAAADAAQTAAGVAEKAAARAQQSQALAAGLVAEATQKAADVEASAAAPAKGSKAAGPPKVPMLTVPVAAADADDESPAAAAEAAGQPAPVSLPTGTLTVDLSTQLHQFWKTAEGTYLTTVTNILAHLRCSREAATLWFRDHRQQYVAFLERDAPSKHKLVSAFQASFNSVDLDFRKEPETKAELALRSSEAQDALWDVCDERQKQNEQLAVTIRDDPEPPARQEADAGKFAELLQGELARVAAARHVLLGSSQARIGLQVDVPALLEVNLLHPDVPQALQSKFDKKSGVAFPAWMPTPPAKQSQQLPMAFRLAWAWLSLVSDEATNWQKPPKAAAAQPAGRAGKEKEATLAGAQASLVAAAPAVLDDVRLARLRLQRIAERSQAHQAQLQEMADSTNAQVAAWQEQRFQGECSAVAALHQLASQAVMDAKTLPHTLRLEGDQLVIDEEIPAIGSH